MDVMPPVVDVITRVDLITLLCVITRASRRDSTRVDVKTRDQRAKGLKSLIND